MSRAFSYFFGQEPPSHSPFWRAVMSSSEWQEVRRRGARRCGYRCEHRCFFFRCRKRGRLYKNRVVGLEAHHVGDHGAYKHLGHEIEHPESIKMLCSRHHRQADAKRRKHSMTRHHHHHHRSRAWPKLLFGLVGAYFVVHGSVFVGLVMLLLTSFYLLRRAS